MHHFTLLQKPSVCYLLTFITHISQGCVTWSIIPQAVSIHHPTSLNASTVAWLTRGPLGEHRSAAAIRPPPVVILSIVKSNPGGCHITAQSVDQLVFVIHVIYGGQVSVLYSAESLSVMPGQGFIDEVVLMKH